MGALGSGSPVLRDSMQNSLELMQDIALKRAMTSGADSVLHGIKSASKFGIGAGNSAFSKMLLPALTGNMVAGGMSRLGDIPSPAQFQPLNSTFETVMNALQDPVFNAQGYIKNLVGGILNGFQS